MNKISTIKLNDFTYVDWFGHYLDGYIYVGNKARIGASLIIYEEGSGMKVHLNGLGYLLNAGKIELDKCIVYCHNRKSSVQPNDVLTVVTDLKNELKYYHLKEVIGIGFSNGAQSICEAYDINPVFDRMIIAGGSPSKKFMDAKVPAVILTNTKGRIKNFDPVGRKLPGVLKEAYACNGTHEDLDNCLTNVKFLEKFINGDTDYSTSGKEVYYKGMLQLDSEYYKYVKKNIKECKYQ